MEPKNKNGYTPFIQAARRGHDTPEAMALLINSGANVNQRDDFGNTALHHVASQNNVVLAEYLLGHGAKVNATNTQV